MFFDTWQGLLRVLVVGVLAYAGLVALLRWSGKRTLSKLNAFDFVVTVALGSTLATILLSKDVALAEGLLAIALLAGLQYVVAWGDVRFSWVGRLIKSEPRLLLRDGDFLEGAMRKERVTRDEILASLRKEGIDDPAEAKAVVLETDGSLSVIR